MQAVVASPHKPRPSLTPSHAHLITYAFMRACMLSLSRRGIGRSLFNFIFVSATFGPPSLPVAMAWRSHGSTNDQLVSNLKSEVAYESYGKQLLYCPLPLSPPSLPSLPSSLPSSLPPLGNGIITSQNVEDAMRSIDRGDYCPYNPYYDSPQQIGMIGLISGRIYSLI